MSKILVSLVSNQTVPNVMFIKEIKEIDKYLFITTEQMEKNHKRDIIIKACSDIVQDNAAYIVVKEDSIMDLQSQLGTYVDNETSDDDVFIVNLTGGTKLMSIGAFDFFRKKESQIFYLTLGKNTYRKIFPDVKHRDFDITYRFTLDDYLQANGISVNRKGEGLKFDIELTKNLFSMFQNNQIKDHLSALKELKEKTRKNPKWYKNHRSKPIGYFEGLGDLLQAVNWDIQEIEKREIQYLRGTWFEEYIYHYCEKILPADMLGINYELDIGQHVNNELDILFMHENCLYIIEAKTNIRGQNNVIKMNEIIYKAAALKKEFGLSCKSYLFHLDKDYEQQQGYQKKLERAKIMGLKVVGLDDLTPDNIQATIKKIMDGTL
ncbi:MAG TPA: DUF1887 family protein [Candidatus Cloacimonetes bacterium]|nr:DUF1887 family protein [Candidatus Cloacimonadota bacterium]HEX37820.1 DUF1887 family protein [Candidatus Cloacimonadota bacterium]